MFHSRSEGIDMYACAYMYIYARLQNMRENAQYCAGRIMSEEECSRKIGMLVFRKIINDLFIFSLVPFVHLLLTSICIS